MKMHGYQSLALMWLITDLATSISSQRSRCLRWLTDNIILVAPSRQPISPQQHCCQRQHPSMEIEDLAEECPSRQFLSCVQQELIETIDDDMITRYADATITGQMPLLVACAEQILEPIQLIDTDQETINILHTIDRRSKSIPVVTVVENPRIAVEHPRAKPRPDPILLPASSPRILRKRKNRLGHTIKKLCAFDPTKRKALFKTLSKKILAN